MRQKYWTEEIVEKILSKRPKQPVVLECGITPSGPYHIGHLREMIITDAVRRELENRKIKTRLVYFIDDMDNLRKLYPFLPKSFEQYVHHPLYKIPSPDGKAKSYPDYFLQPFLTSIQKLGIDVETIYAHQWYREGKMTAAVSTALKKRDEFAEIIARVSHRELPEGWQPFEPLDETCGRIRGAKILDVDVAKTRVKYLASDNSEKWADYSKGQGKLPWRVDWPARWALLNIAFEPFGKEHAAAGGSFDVGKEIVEKIYGGKAPQYQVYEHIYLSGERKKMSASLGNLIEIDKFLEVVPPAVARYFVLRSKNERHLVFDSGQGLIQLTDEFARLEEKVIAGEALGAEKTIYRLSQTSKKRVTVQAPFSHLATVYQAAQGDFEEVKRLLVHSGHIEAVESEEDLKNQVDRVANWLKLYAPEDIKFKVLKEAPQFEASEKEKKTLEAVKEAVESGEKDIDLHNSIYEAGKTEGLNPRETFAVVYKIFLGKDSGPKAGFFLTMLGKDFVLKRIGKYL